MSRRLLIGAAVILLVAPGTVRAEVRPDFLMDEDPSFQLPEPVKEFTPASIGLWIQALQRPEIDLQRMAAETIALAHAQGIPNLAQTIPALETILAAESSHPVARFAAARALIALESRGSSQKLLDASQQYGADLRRLVEPALARWNIESSKQIWVERLTAINVRPGDLLLAIHSLGETREVSALPKLKSLALNHRHNSDVRVAAASAAGRLADAGLEPDALSLCRSKQSSPIVNRLCAIRLLARHTDDASRQLLIELAVDAEPAIAAAALRRLTEIDPALVLPLAETAMKNADPEVRRQGANAYLVLPNRDRIGPVALLLDDDHPEIRKQVCEGLSQLSSNPDLSDPIRDSAMKILHGDRWQGQEQASLLLGALKYMPASMRMVELLESSRNEVKIASAWGLKMVADPRTIDAIVDKAQRETDARRPDSNPPQFDFQVAHLFEACGRMRVKQAIPLLKRHIPKDLVLGERARGAAIWALGWIHEGTPDKSVCDGLLGRIQDDSLLPPESFLVKRQCAISLARMKDVAHGAAVRKYLGNVTPNTLLGVTLRWAVKELTGEEMPPPIPVILGQGVWFLDPLPPPESKKQ